MSAYRQIPDASGSVQPISQVVQQAAALPASAMAQTGKSLPRARSRSTSRTGGTQWAMARQLGTAKQSKTAAAIGRLRRRSGDERQCQHARRDRTARHWGRLALPDRGAVVR